MSELFESENRYDEPLPQDKKPAEWYPPEESDSDFPNS
jgi:hypothetical protein